MHHFEDYYLHNNCLEVLHSLISSNPVDLIQYGNIKKYHFFKKRECTVIEEEVVEKGIFFRKRSLGRREWRGKKETPCSKQGVYRCLWAGKDDVQEIHAILPGN